jgi:hypothetical protein
MKKIGRDQPFTNSLTSIIQIKFFYLGYLENSIYIGKIARTPENDLAFETKNWAFFWKAFNIAD